MFLTYRFRSRSLDKLANNIPIPNLKKSKDAFEKAASSYNIKPGRVQELIKKFDNLAETNSLIDESTNLLRKNDDFLASIKQQTSEIKSILADLSDSQIIDNPMLNNADNLGKAMKRQLTDAELEKLGMPRPPPGFKAPEYSEDVIQSMIKNNDITNKLIDNKINMVLVENSKDVSKQINDFSKDLKKLNIKFENPGAGTKTRNFFVGGINYKIKPDQIPAIEFIIKKNNSDNFIKK